MVTWYLTDASESMQQGPLFELETNYYVIQ